MRHSNRKTERLRSFDQFPQNTLLKVDKGMAGLTLCIKLLQKDGTEGSISRCRGADVWRLFKHQTENISDSAILSIRERS